MSNFKKGFYRLNIAIDCESQQEMAQAQAILKELESVLKLSAKDLIRLAPIVRKNQTKLRTIFDKISQKGITMAVVPDLLALK